MDTCLQETEQENLENPVNCKPFELAALAQVTTLTYPNRDQNMDNTQESDRLRDLYLTGVRPNGRDIGVGAYGRVFEVECFGAVWAAKEVHPILVQGVRREEFEATKKGFLTECIRSGSLAHPNIVLFLGVYNHRLYTILVVSRYYQFW